MASPLRQTPASGASSPSTLPVMTRDYRFPGGRAGRRRQSLARFARQVIDGGLHAALLMRHAGDV